MADNNNTQAEQQPPEPDSAQEPECTGRHMESIRRGTRTGYLRMDGRRLFPEQHVDLNGNKGIEIIGRERGYGATEPSRDIKPRYCDSIGNTFDYVYEVDDDTLTIWGWRKGFSGLLQGQVERRWRH
jgi:hypothetical protein